MDSDSLRYPILIAVRASLELDRRLTELVALIHQAHPELQVSRSDLLREQIGRLTPLDLPLKWQPVPDHAPFQSVPTQLGGLLATLLQQPPDVIRADGALWAHLGEVLRLVEVLIQQHRHP